MALTFAPLQPVNALGAYVQGQQYQQQNALAQLQQKTELEKQAALRDQSARGASEDQRKQQLDLLDRIAQVHTSVMSAPPEQQDALRNQAVDMFKRIYGEQAEPYRSPEAFNAAGLAAKRELGKLINVAPGGALVDPQNPSQPVYQQPFKPEPAEKPPQPPSGYEAAPGGGLKPIAGGPADPSVMKEKPTPLTAEARTKLAQLEIAERSAKDYLKMVINPNGSFNETTARMPQAARLLRNSIRAKLRAESGATITEEEVDGEMGRYGPELISSGATNAEAAKRLLQDIGVSRSTLAQDSPQGGASVQIQDAPAREQRQPGQVYNTPRGKMKWTGTGWLPEN